MYRKLFLLALIILTNFSFAQALYTTEANPSKKTKVFLKKQINKIFKKSNNYEEVVIAYEPLWSIGTGLTPKLSEIDDILGFLSKILENYSFKKINILYGGSVNLSNIKDILSLRNLNGVLVGSASTKSSFIKHFK